MNQKAIEKFDLLYKIPLIRQTRSARSTSGVLNDPSSTNLAGAFCITTAILVYNEIQLRRRIFQEIHREVAKVGSLVQERTESLIEETHAQLRADTARFRDSLERFRMALADFDPSSSSEVLRELRETDVPAQMDRDIAHIEELVENFEYDDAAAIVAQLLERVV